MNEREHYEALLKAARDVVAAWSTGVAADITPDLEAALDKLERVVRWRENQQPDGEAQ